MTHWLKMFLILYFILKIFENFRNTFNFRSICRFLVRWSDQQLFGQILTFYIFIFMYCAFTLFLFGAKKMNWKYFKLLNNNSFRIRQINFNFPRKNLKLDSITIRQLEPKVISKYCAFSLEIFCTSEVLQTRKALLSKVD